MPFTPSHVAAVLPLLRTPLPAAALVIGSISPDLPYYLPGAPAWPMHTAVAIVTIDPALGLLAWGLWHGLLSRPVLHWAPRGVRARLGPTGGSGQLGLGPRLTGVRHLALVVLALAVGAATHVGWDELTHQGRWGADHVPALRQVWAGLEGYRWAQYASGLLGAGVVLGWAWRGYRAGPASPVPARASSRVVWAALVGSATVLGTFAAGHERSWRAAAFTGATTGGGVLLLGLALSGLVLTLRDRATPEPR